MLRLIFIPAFLIGIASLMFVSSRRNPADCLPKDIKATDVVSAPVMMQGRALGNAKIVRVGDKLKELGARCRRGKLVDAKGREIRFYHLQGCWGNPPSDYLEIMERQRQELESLKKKYTVIEMTCNDSGEMPM